MAKPAKELRVKIEADCLSDYTGIRDWRKFNAKDAEIIERVNIRNEDGLTPLHLAARYNQYDVATALLEKGAIVNARSIHGYTPLHMAANYIANPQVAEILIAKGANVNARDEDGNSPLHFAIIRNSELLVELLLKNGADVLMKNENQKTAMELGNENKDFHLSDAYWLLNDAAYSQKDNPKNE
jgi:ankyrin repeat protein